MRKIDRTGETKLNVDGFEMKIIEYKDNKNMKVLFPQFNIVRNAVYAKFKVGKVYPTLRNKGLASIKNLDEYNYIYDDYDETEENIENNAVMGIVMATGLSLLLSVAITAIIYVFVCLF